MNQVMIMTMVTMVMSGLGTMMMTIGLGIPMAMNPVMTEMMVMNGHGTMMTGPGIPMAMRTAMMTTGPGIPMERKTEMMTTTGLGIPMATSPVRMETMVIMAIAKTPTTEPRTSTETVVTSMRT